MYKDQKLKWTISNTINSKLLKTASETLNSQRCSDNVFATFLKDGAQLNKAKLFYRVGTNINKACFLDPIFLPWSITWMVTKMVRFSLEKMVLKITQTQTAYSFIGHKHF